jgi:ribonuclease G
MNSSDTFDDQEQNLTQEQETELKHPPVDEPGESVDPEQLKKEVEERARQRPILQKLAAKIRNEKTPYREIIINSYWRNSSWSG